jgi:hypothetical protein
MVAHLDDLFGDPVEILAVGEVPVGVAAAVASGRRGVAALEDLRLGRPRVLSGLGLRVKSWMR